ncbi:MAG: DUF192 domain-containing protein [Gammaproteobacteria bacterium]|nr:DUF192 domain-containing protein [Gammaproteobacteria bacterium]
MKAQTLFYSLGLFALAFMSGCNAAEDDCVIKNEGMESMHLEGITLFDDNGNTKHIRSLIADDHFERAMGFQHVCPDAVKETRILFVYTEPIQGSFHMSNVKAPLDIGFFDGQGTLIDVLRMDVYTDDAQPLYSPNKPYQFALETPVGFFEESMLSPGKSRLVIGSL